MPGVPIPSLAFSRNIRIDLMVHPRPAVSQLHLMDIHEHDRDQAAVSLSKAVPVVLRNQNIGATIITPDFGAEVIGRMMPPPRVDAETL